MKKKRKEKKKHGETLPKLRIGWKFGMIRDFLIIWFEFFDSMFIMKANCLLPESS